MGLPAPNMTVTSDSPTSTSRPVPMNSEKKIRQGKLGRFTSSIRSPLQAARLFEGTTSTQTGVTTFHSREVAASRPLEGSIRKSRTSSEPWLAAKSHRPVGSMAK